MCMEQPTLSSDSHVLLLVASHLGSGDSTDGGLGPAGWYDFEQNISTSGVSSPGELLQRNTDNWPSEIWTTEATQDWVEKRLGRSSHLALELEELNNRGIWVTTVYEPEYPKQLKKTLGRKAPPFLYVAGQAAHLSEQAVGFVGSRDVTERDREFTRDLVNKVIDEEYAVVSGGAKGIDETSERVGLERGGPVIEFPTEGIGRCLEDAAVRDAVIDEKLTLASHYHPRASWNVGAAMGRNKLIHGFGKYTVVVRSGETGGTWEGSNENLSHDWSTLLVCDHADTPAGNQALLEKGGVAIDPSDIPSTESLDSWVEHRKKASQKAERNSKDDGSGSQSSLDQFD